MVVLLQNCICTNYYQKEGLLMFNKKLFILGIFWISFMTAVDEKLSIDGFSLLPIVGRIDEIRAEILSQEPNMQEAFQQILRNREIRDLLSHPEYRVMLAEEGSFDFFSGTPVSIANLVSIFRDPELQEAVNEEEGFQLNVDDMPAEQEPQEEIELPSFSELSAGVPAPAQPMPVAHPHPESYQEFVRQVESSHPSAWGAISESFSYPASSFSEPSGSSAQKRLKEESDSQEEGRLPKRARLSQDNFFEWALSREPKDDMSDDEGPLEKMRL